MNSPKFMLCVVLLLSLFQLSYAQITIDGTVTDSELIPINNALIEIIDRNDTLNYYSKYTNESGYFIISNITDIKFRKNNLPSDIITLRNYPNPFNPSTKIYYELPNSQKIEIRIYDILGREIKTLLNDFHRAGTYTLNWDGRNNWNNPVAAGVYFCSLKTKDQLKVHKMVLLDGGSKSSSPIMKKQNKLKETNNYSKVNDSFNFTLKVSGEDIISTEFSELNCASDTTLYLLIPRVIKRITIGISGGVVDIENFEMKIPKGAFDSNTELIIFERQSDEFDNDNTSKIIGIEGMPLSFNHSLDLKLIPYIEPSNESFITVGQDYEIPFLGTSELVYKFMETHDSSGVLYCKLPSHFNNSLNIKDKITSSYNQHKIYFSSKNGYSSKISYYKRFKVFAPTNTPLGFDFVASTVGNTFETNFDVVKSVGFDTVNINWPVEIYVKQLKPKLYDRVCVYVPTYGYKNMSIYVDERRIGALNWNSIREYAIGVARSYDIKEFFLPLEFTGKVNPARYWFHHALASWFEGKKSKSGDPYHPTDYFRWEDNGTKSDNRFAPFNGMQYGSYHARSVISHGGGMSSFIKYIDMNYGGKLIVNIYDLIREKNYHPIDAVKSFFDDSYLWWPDYISQLVDSKLYPFMELYSNLSHLHPEGEPLWHLYSDRYKFKNKNDTLKIFHDYGGVYSSAVSLSAKSYLIEWNREDIDTSRIMRIRLKESENTFFVYMANHTYGYWPMMLLGRGQTYSINISDLIRVANNGLLVLVTNSESEAPYNNRSKYKLEVKLEKPKSLPYNFAQVYFVGDGVYSGRPINAQFSYGDEGFGSFSGDDFSSTWDSTWSTVRDFGSITITVNPDDLVASYEVETTSIDSLWGNTHKLFIQGDNIPLQINEDNELEFESRGYDACSHVSVLTYEHIYDNGDVWKLTNFNCSETSWFWMRLRYK